MAEHAPEQPVDTRQAVGGIVWARAESVSRDFKRILGSAFSAKWIKGKVISVDKRKNNAQSKRPTTHVTGCHPCGEDESGVAMFKFEELSLQITKSADPNCSTVTVTATATASPAAPIIDAPSTPTTGTTAASTATAGTNSTGFGEALCQHGCCCGC